MSKDEEIAVDENNSLVRFADAVAGFVRDVLDGDRGEAKKLFATKEEDIMGIKYEVFAL